MLSRLEKENKLSGFDSNYVQNVLAENGYLNLFVEKIKLAAENWKEVLKNSPEHMSGAKSLERSVFLQRRCTELVGEALEGDYNVSTYESHMTVCFVFFEQISVRFKKLDSNKRPMNVQTKRNKDLWFKQSQPLLPGDFKRWVNITFGWQLDRFTGAIISLHVVNEFGNKIAWEFEVDMDSAVISSVSQEEFVFGSEEQGYTLTLRDTKRSQEIKDQDKEDDVDEDVT